MATETEDEWEFVKNRIQRESTGHNDKWHIGLYRNASTGNWIWVSGEPLTIQKWQPGKPVSEASRNVVVIAKTDGDGNNGLFNNIDGKLHMAYICEVTKMSEYKTVGNWLRNSCTSCAKSPSTMLLTRY